MTVDAAMLVFAVAPQALGGVRLRSHAGPQREAWLAQLRALLPAAMPWRRMPAHIGDEALLGGLDLAATLAAQRPVMQQGLLAQAEGGVVVAAMAERIGPALASRLAAVLDADSAPPAVVALDEGCDDDERPPASLLDRIALHVQLEGRRTDEAPDDVRVALDHARASWQHVRVDDALIDALVATAASLGIDSMRAALHAVNVARIVAALDGREQATQDDAAAAARLVLAPRATRLPPAPAELPPDEPPAEPPPADANVDAPGNARDGEPPRDDDADHDADHDTDHDPTRDDAPLDDRVIAAALAAIPPGLLAQLAAGKAQGSRRGDAGRVGQLARSQQRGRPMGSVRGEPRGGARLALIDTLRAAAPWQRVRRAQAARASEVAATGGAATPGGVPNANRVLVTRDDLRIQRRVQHRATTTIFAIDASGSQAMHRLAEAKGAVELLLADCYARRDRVAVIGFRGAGAQLLLAPTRSLVRAKRQLAGLPGGGGTPLADGIDAAAMLAATVRRAGATPLVVLLTDGRANIARGGKPGRPEAAADAIAAARAFGAAGTTSIVIDTSPQPGRAASDVADAMGARCIVLPYAAAQDVSSAVRHARGGSVPPRSLRSLPPEGAVSGFGRPGATDVPPRSLRSLPPEGAVSGFGRPGATDGP
jgi:magnesium chelatase subunit D